MSNLPEGCAPTATTEKPQRRRSSRRRVALLVLPSLSFALSCGVQEHLHDAPGAEMTVGGKFAPPPITPEGGTAASTGGTGTALGGQTSGGTAAGGNPTTGGNVGAGGSNTGGFSTNGGASTSGGFSSNGGNANGGNPTGGNANGGSGVGGSSTTGGSATGGNKATGGSATGGSATGGSSGIMVDINGTMLPKESVIGFIHIGHSNMAGRSSSPSASRAYHFTDMNLRAWIYRGGNWSPALEPNTAGDQDAKRFNQGGPGTSLLKQAVDLAPTRYFVSMGYGIGSAYCSQFLPGALYYDQFMAAPKALKGKITFGAIVIMLGITERHGTAADISGYPQCINKLVTAIRTDLAEPNMPLLINDYEMGATGAELSPTGTFAQQIIPQIKMIPSVVSNSALVPTDSIAMQDDHHFNLDGQKTWSGRVLSVMKMKGWFPW